MLRFQSSSEVSSNAAAEAMPALQTTMSRPPNPTTASRVAASTLASLVTSIATPATASRPKRLPNSSTRASRLARSMSASTTQAPSPKSLAAIAEPMPPAPPVMSATRPASDFGFGMRWSLASSNNQYSMLNASCSARPTYLLTLDAPRMTLMALT